MRRMYAVLLTEMLCILSGCTGNAETMEPSSLIETVGDAAAWEMQLRTAIAEAAPSVSGWMTVEQEAEILPQIAALVHRVSDSETDAMFLSSVTWESERLAGGIYVTVRLCYTGTAEEICRKKEQLYAETETWVSQYALVPDDVYLLLAHDALIRRCRYDAEANVSHTAYGAWIGGAAVCDGYAAAFCRLAEKRGIPCLTVRGAVLEEEGSWIAHAWNLVQLSGAWYHIDCTWDDTDRETPLHTWFLCNDTDMMQTHRWDSARYPAASGGAFSYDAILAEMQQ